MTRQKVGQILGPDFQHSHYSKTNLRDGARDLSDKFSAPKINYPQRKELRYLPRHQNPGAILQRLRQMRRLDVLTPRQVCNGARQFQDTVIGARREIHLRHG